MMFRDLFVGEAQRDPHHWSATFSGHAWLLLGPWGVIAIGWDMWTAAWVVPVLYGLLWELPQYLTAKRQTRALAWDCVCDTVAVAFGCYAAAALGNGQKMLAMSCWASTVIVMLIGWRVRR